MGKIILLTYDLVMGYFLPGSSLLFYKTQECGFFFFLVLGFGVGWWWYSFQEEVGAGRRFFRTGKPADGFPC